MSYGIGPIFCSREFCRQASYGSVHVPDLDQCANIVTKALSPFWFCALQSKLKVVDLHASHHS